MANKEHAKSIEEHAKAKNDRAKAVEDKVKAIEVRAKAAKSRATQVMEEYKDFNTFEANTTVATTRDYNLRFDDSKKKVADTFPKLDLHQITPIGKLKED